MFRRTASRTAARETPQHHTSDDVSVRAGVVRVVQDPNTPGGFRNEYEPPTSTEGEAQHGGS